MVVGLRVGLLALSAGALVAAPLSGRPLDLPAGDSGERYTCPMHGQVQANEAGTCPLCGMALDRVRARAQVGPPDQPVSVQDLGVVTRRLVGGEGAEVRAPSWMESEHVATAIVYNEVLQAMGAETRGTFLRPGVSTGGVQVRLLPVPPVAWDQATSRVRFRIDAPAASAAAPRLGEVGYVLFARRSNEVLVVPSAAVVQAPDGPYVLAPSADRRTFLKKPVTIGGNFSGLTVVLSGVGDHDVIVGRNVFFPDAERRAQSASSAREAAR